MGKTKTAQIAKVETPADVLPPVTSIKGFDGNLQCRGFQFEVGKTYTVSGNIKACSNGFHACPVDEHPLSVFEFYAPAGNRFFEVKQEGARDKQDTKLASASITIGVEISLGDLAQRAVKWVFDRANWKNGSVATGENEGATASGTRGAATASGTRGAATASGNSGAATASGFAQSLADEGRDETRRICAEILKTMALEPAKRDDPRTDFDYRSYNTMDYVCTLVFRQPDNREVRPTVRVGRTLTGDPQFLGARNSIIQTESTERFVLALVPRWMTGAIKKAGTIAPPIFTTYPLPLDESDPAFTAEDGATWERLRNVCIGINSRNSQRQPG